MSEFRKWINSVDQALAEGKKKSDLYALLGKISHLFQNNEIVEKLGDFLNWLGALQSNNCTDHPTNSSGQESNSAGDPNNFSGETNNCSGEATNSSVQATNCPVQSNNSSVQFNNSIEENSSPKDTAIVAIEPEGKQPRPLSDIYESTANMYEHVVCKIESDERGGNQAGPVHDMKPGFLDVYHDLDEKVTNPKLLDSAAVTLLKVKNLNMENGWDKDMRCFPFGIVRLYCTVLIIAGLLSANWFAGFIAYMTGMKSSLFYWLLSALAGLYHLGSYGVILLCYLSAKYSGKVIFYIQKIFFTQANAQQSCKQFQIFKYLSTLIYIKGILLVLYGISMLIFTWATFLILPNCTVSSFNFYMATEKLIVTMTAILNCSIILDVFYVRKVSALGQAGFSDMFRMLCCCRIHSSRAKSAKK